MNNYSAHSFIVHKYLQKKSIKLNVNCAFSTLSTKYATYLKRACYPSPDSCQVLIRELIDVAGNYAGAELIPEFELDQYTKGKRLKGPYETGHHLLEARKGQKSRPKQGFSAFNFDVSNIKSLKDAIVCAGFADGFRIAQATNKAVLCGVGEGNIASIAKELKSVNENCLITTVYDNDLSGYKFAEASIEAGFTTTATEDSFKDASDLYQAFEKKGEESALQELREHLSTPLPCFVKYKEIRLPDSTAKKGKADLKKLMYKERSTETTAAATLAMLKKDIRYIPLLYSKQDWLKYAFKYAPSKTIRFSTLEEIYEKYAQFQLDSIIKQASCSAKISHDCFQQNTKVKVKRGYTLTEEAFNAHNVIALNWGTGDGKTQNVAMPFMQIAEKFEGKRVMITNRKTLVAELVARTGFTSYQDIVKENAAIEKDLVICSASLAFNEYQHILKSADYVFIDEFSQTLQSMPSTVSQQADRKVSNYDTYSSLVQIIKHSKKLVVADAHVSDYDINFIQEIRGEQVSIFDMKRENDATVYTSKLNVSDIVNRAFESLINNERLMICADNKNQVTAIHTMLIAKIKSFAKVDTDFNVTEKDLLLVHADNAKEEAQEKFIEHADSESLKYMCVLYSPVIASGVSIEHKMVEAHKRVSYVIAVANCMTKSTDIIQMMRRVRYVKKIYLYIAQNKKAKIESKEAMLKGAREASLLQGLKTSKKFDEFCAELKARENANINNLAVYLYVHLKDDGFKIKTIDEELLNDSDSFAIKQLRENMKEEKMRLIVNARDISLEAFDKMMSSDNLSEAEQASKNKFLIKQTLGIPTDAPLYLDDVEIFMKSQDKMMARNDSLVGILDPYSIENDRRKNLLFRKNKAAEELSFRAILKDVNVYEEGITDKSALAIVKRIKKHRELYAHLGILSSAAKWTKRGKDFDFEYNRILKNPKGYIKKFFEHNGIFLKRAGCYSSAYYTIDDKKQEQFNTISRRRIDIKTVLRDIEINEENLKKHREKLALTGVLEANETRFIHKRFSANILAAAKERAHNLMQEKPTSNKKTYKLSSAMPSIKREAEAVLLHVNDNQILENLTCWGTVEDASGFVDGGQIVETNTIQLAEVYGVHIDEVQDIINKKRKLEKSFNDHALLKNVTQANEKAH